KGWATQVFLNAPRQGLVNQIVNFAVNAVARDKDLLEQRELLVIIVNLALDEGADLLACIRAGGNVSQMMDDRGHLLVEASLDESYRVRGKCFRERGAALGQIVKPTTDEVAHRCGKSGFAHQPTKTLFNET